jgi:hypothetical protein
MKTVTDGRVSVLDGPTQIRASRADFLLLAILKRECPVRRTLALLSWFQIRSTLAGIDGHWGEREDCF